MTILTLYDLKKRILGKIVDYRTDYGYNTTQEPFVIEDDEHLAEEILALAREYYEMWHSEDLPEDD